MPTWSGPQIVVRDVPARYLLRLGMGEAELETELDFSRVGRVNAMLARRLELLAEVSGWGVIGTLRRAEEVAAVCHREQGALCNSTSTSPPKPPPF